MTSVSRGSTRRPRLSPPARRAASARKALDGIRVVDFTRQIAGPYATLLLADLGADVIKIEKPGTGDDSRGMQPPSLGGQSATYLWANRNKRGIVLDLQNQAGCEIARELAARADVVVENFSTGVMDRLGLSYEALSKRNPRLIYCSVSAFGRTGGLASRPGYDPVIQAESGLMALNGFPDGEPMRIGPPLIDVSAGMMASNAIMAALIARQRDGLGQYVETSLFETAIVLTGQYGMNFLMTGDDQERFGNSSRTAQPIGVFNCQDGPVFLACANDRNYQRLALEVLDRPDLAADPQYATNELRLANSTALKARLQAAFSTVKRAAALERALRWGVPLGIVRTVEEAFGGEDFATTGMLSAIPHPSAGTVPNIAAPFRLEGTPLADPVSAPLLGQHTEAVLREVLGYDDDRMAKIRLAGALGR
jgi:crotonobetainyl-CoA:carnitine CoA-transferase CaiB-like acyl-CoA transferase